ncbi:outer membrane lipoprotein [Bordetella ansorpii]|uniref:Outer membrane lipoprotein n=1 Tax=Bordetella ansorpii TaxID=288768 RepID=A0A157SP88_9BORD|nr:outer membrane lipoprotein [Bordetella ansorpii]
MMRAWPIVLAAGAALALGGCGVSEALQALRGQARQQQQALDAEQRQFKRGMTDPRARLAAQEVDKPWLAGPAQPLAREVLLPPALRADVDTTLLFAGRLDLPGIAERLQRATGIAVRVHPDALLPHELFLPRLAEQATLAVGAATRIEIQSGPRPLPDTLDALAAQLYLQWRYHQGAIEFYRTQTRVFDVRALTLSSRVEARIGRAASAQAGGFESASSTSLSSGDQQALQAVRSRLEPFLTRAGVIAQAEGGGTSLVVTDTPAVLDRIATFVARENRALTRRVRLVFEEITVQTRDDAEAGIDWSAVYDSLRGVASLSLPADTNSAAAAASAAVAGGPFTGSRAVVSALSTLGAVVRHASVPLLTLNRRPITHAVRSTFSYVDQVQSVAVPAAGGVSAALPSVSISQKQETVGTVLTLVPDAQDDGSILLSVSYDNTVAQPLKSISFGESGNQLQVQQIAVDGSGTVQQVELRPGVPVILSGFDRREDEYERRRVLPDAPLLAGGRDRRARDRLTTVVLITAQAEDGV